MSLDHAKGEVDQRWYDPSKDYGGSPIRLEKGDIVKCNFCLHRITLGFKRGLRHGVDREATPACVNACNAGARMFGDLDDPGSEISRVLRERKVFRLRPELATQPSVYYISNGYTFYNLDNEQR
jgi:phenylacetyl-CoA:acceptor oxidoreductase subunit 1